jgi:hypothetical protein
VSSFMGYHMQNLHGQSVVDYLICSQSFTSRVLKFDIGDCPIEMKYDDAPLFVKLDFPTSPRNNQILGIQKKNLSKGKILINQENRERFSVALKQQFQVIKYNKAYMTTNETSDHVHGSLLIPIIHKALSACKMSHPNKKATSTFLANPWYDEECKATKKSLKERKWGKENKKKYERSVHSKKEEYVNARRGELISLGKHNPKGFWRELLSHSLYFGVVVGEH